MTNLASHHPGLKNNNNKQNKIKLNQINKKKCKKNNIYIFYIF